MIENIKINKINEILILSKKNNDEYKYLENSIIYLS